MGIWKQLSGTVAAELVSADLPGAYDAINSRQITLYGISQTDTLTARFTVSRKDYALLEKLIRERGEKLTILGRKGFFWSLRALFRRPVLTAGLLLLLSLTVFLPTRVLFVEVTGNHRVPARSILEAANECGIRFGASRQRVRSEKMKNELLAQLPELKWAGVNTYGCVAVISVTERPRLEAPEDAALGHIVACTDGVIDSCTVTQGTALCEVGQAVGKGQILISGYTDCGGAILLKKAQGEVYARTLREFTAVTPDTCYRKQPSGESHRRYSLLLGKKRIFFWKGSGICRGSCDRIEIQYRFTLPGGFALPVAVCVEEITPYETVPQSRSCPETLLRDFSRSSLTQQMTAGVITQEDTVVLHGDGVWSLEGQYICREMIGRQKREQIGDYHGENTGTNGERGTG